MQLFSEQISDFLTRSVYKFKITYREPTADSARRIEREETSIQLENKTKKR
jgi:hypothetical protein